VFPDPSSVVRGVSANVSQGCIDRSQAGSKKFRIENPSRFDDLQEALQNQCNFET
jgi:hypothetical protein